ncbi:29644_t:CDS:1, partial [Racocetra persica]
MSEGVSDTNIDDNQSKNDGDSTKTKRKKYEDYLETQLKAYILRLKTDDISTHVGVEPNSIDHKQWSTFLKTVKTTSEELKRRAELTYVGVLFSQTYKVMQKSKERIFKDDKGKKEWIKIILTNSIPDDTSNTQIGRSKQAYEHITDLISKLESQGITIEIWYPLLYKA